MRALFLGFVVLLVTEACVAAARREPAFDENELLSGRVLALPESRVNIPTHEEVFALDEEMRAFVEPLKALRSPRLKMQALIRGLEERGMFSLDYAEVTRTPIRTFHDRQGNCLSFTMLFVTLARAAGLSASYQSVDVPPAWSYEGQVVTANHVNTSVRTAANEETIVDFNIRPYEDGQRRRRLSDAHALGLFYANLGAEAILRGDYAAALVYLREAAGVDGDIPATWVNLGVLYSRHGMHRHAEAAYLRALESDDEEQSALANLALAYQALGESELAAEYRERVQSYRERNPFYHYAIAVRAYEEQQFDAALSSLRKALRLKQDEPEFHALRGEVESALGNERRAARSFERASEYTDAAESRTQSRIAFEAPSLR